MNEQDKKIKDLLQGHFKESVPSADFTQDVMNRLVVQQELKEQKIFKYKPVISKRAWLGIALLFLGMVYLSFTDSKEQTDVNVKTYDFDWSLDASLFHSEYILFAALSILSLLVLDRLFRRYRFG